MTACSNFRILRNIDFWLATKRSMMEAIFFNLMKAAWFA